MSESFEAANSTLGSAWQLIGKLNGLDRATLIKLAELGSIRTFPQGTVLFSEGEHHEQLYFLGRGTVQLQMLTPASDRQTILTVGEGELLAWSALIGDGRMTATAIAAEETMAAVFEVHKLKAALEVDFQLGYQLMKGVAKALARRLVATRLQLLDLYHR